MKCRSPLHWDSLLAYRLGELDADAEARIEEHYLGCAPCSRRLELLHALAIELRAVTGAGGVNLAVTGRFLRRLTDHGVKVREYRVPRNGSVNCSVAPDDDVVAACLEAPLDDVQRVDLVYLDSDGRPDMRQQDLPFVAESGAVVFAARTDALRALPRSTLHLRLLAVDETRERTLGDYRFNHTPHHLLKPD